MTQGDLDKLREKYSFLSGVQLRIPGEGEMILSTRLSEVAFYEAVFPAGLSAICPAMSSGVCTLSARCQTRGEKRCNKLPVLNEIEAKRMAEVFEKDRARGLLRGFEGPAFQDFPELCHRGSACPCLPKKVERRLQPKATIKRRELGGNVQPPLKGVIIQEKRRNDAHDPVPTKKGEVDDSKGKEAMPTLFSLLKFVVLKLVDSDLNKYN
ncbi:hypothetical protein Acr_00g0030190 [Actinidia rufa]|uniref:Uncharacterized protein n=1 Tax=Actinidia rufa TaxID=165716 RepID=A0A7J0DES4_9ERIC|nr:hypothetical protein Acr_00g0030190 [Actinidia rufa]